MQLASFHSIADSALPFEQLHISVIVFSIVIRCDVLKLITCTIHCSD